MSVQSQVVLGNCFVMRWSIKHPTIGPAGMNSVSTLAIVIRR